VAGAVSDDVREPRDGHETRAAREPRDPRRVIEEAARLVDALSGLSDLRGGPSDRRPGGTSDGEPEREPDREHPTWTGRGWSEHTGPECRICPICRLIAGLREMRPEVLGHLVGAAEEVLAAVREFAAPGSAGSSGSTGSPTAGSPGPGSAAGPTVADGSGAPPSGTGSASERPRVEHIDISD
jgi:hypothetical protein